MFQPRKGIWADTKSTHNRPHCQVHPPTECLLSDNGGSEGIMAAFQPPPASEVDREWPQEGIWWEPLLRVPQSPTQKISSSENSAPAPGLHCLIKGRAWKKE